jgi:signal transduction histidine kinase
MLERVIQNLVDNALKNTAAGGIINATVKVDGGYVLFNIENNGSIIQPDVFNWINSFPSNTPGLLGRPQKTGLGLVIVQKILQLHDSFLSIRREEGHNNFSFSLPVHKFSGQEVERVH